MIKKDRMAEREREKCHLSAFMNPLTAPLVCLVVEGGVFTVKVIHDYLTTSVPASLRSITYNEKKKVVPVSKCSNNIKK